MCEMKSCPFCGDKAEMDGNVGTQLDIYCYGCGACIGIQKSDHLTKEENGTWNGKTYQYSKQVEKKVRNILISIWNKRISCIGKKQ